MSVKLGDIVEVKKVDLETDEVYFTLVGIVVKIYEETNNFYVKSFHCSDPDALTQWNRYGKGIYVHKLNNGRTHYRFRRIGRPREIIYKSDTRKIIELEEYYVGIGGTSDPFCRCSEEEAVIYLIDSRHLPTNFTPYQNICKTYVLFKEYGGWSDGIDRNSVILAGRRAYLKYLEDLINSSKRFHSLESTLK